MGRQLLPRDARAAQYLRHLVSQRDGFETNLNRKGEMAYYGYRGAWGEIKIKNGYEGYFHAMTMKGRGGVGQTTENILMKTGLNEA